MIQMDLEERQSSRFSRPFMVTDYDDEAFSDSFKGFNVQSNGFKFLVG